ncbi:MAG TPA: SDR family NAD(P)-dependent oxidoreductase [Gemmatimonadaceae bacterium]|nr:SDR family NAD(P)-dependent oxidoreductase [Gemmatimonadaceae bacterium]
MPTALVTGASRGIGRAIALRLAADHDVVAVARSADALQALARGIEARGGRCRAIPLDVTDAAAVRERLAGVEVDVLVNNAGVGVMKPLLEMAPEEWARQLDVNVNALYHVTRAVLPGMVDRGRGYVITIGSLAGRNTFAGGTAYTGTKHFVIGFSESLMLEVRDRGVRVSVVMPGSVDTDFGRGRTGAEWKLTADEVADAVAYLVSTPPHALVSRVEMRPAIPKK